MSEQDASDAGADIGSDGPDADDDPGVDPEASADTEAGTDTEDDSANADGRFDAVDVGRGVDIDGEVEPGEELLERVEEADPEAVARELAALRAGVEGLEAELDAREEELDEVTSKLKRKQADFQNYKKRMEKRREQERERATEGLVERLLDVRDNLVRALDQPDPDVEDIRGGVESTLREFDRVLEDENVEVVDPDPGDEVDPQRHEVLMRVESDQPADTIADVHRPGYVMAGKVLRPTQVTVSDGTEGGADDRTADSET